MREQREAGVKAVDRLHRSCRRLIWLNPLLGYEGFEANEHVVYMHASANQRTSRRVPRSYVAYAF